MDPILKKAFFWLIFLAFNLVIIEVALRVFNYFYPSSVFYQASYNQYRSKPHSDNYGFILNAGGFKDIEYPAQKTANKYRIVGLGDSFTFGVVPYPYNFLTILEDSLNRVPFLPETEVINMGISSTDPPQYLSMLVEEVLPLTPDMVLLSLFVGNDIQGSSHAFSRKRKYLHHSYLLSAFYYLYIVSTSIDQKVSYNFYGSGMTYCDSCSTFSADKYLEIERKRSYICQKDNPLLLNDIEDTLFYLRQILGICKSKNISLVVVLLPDEMQVSENLRNKVTSLLKITSSQWDNEQPQRLLSEKMQRLGVPVISLLDPFVVHSTIEPSLYIPNDSHWNIQGNVLAARLLLEELPRIMLETKQK
jgi:hypothetical protein